jgi:hypothetical protein
MAKRIGRTAVEDFTEIKQFASSNEIALALRKLQRCLTEVRGSVERLVEK